MDLSPISPAHRSSMPELFALAISAGVLIRSGRSNLDDALNCYIQIYIATLALFSGMALLPLRLIANPSNAPNPTTQRWIRRLGTVTVATSFATIVLTVTNSALPSPQAVSWASEWVLIVLAIGATYKSINMTSTSWFQQYIQVGIFCLCVAVAGVYIEPIGSMASTISFSSVVHRTYQVHRFGLVQCTFALGALLLVIGVAVPGGSAAGQFVSVTFKEVFAALTLSVGCVTLLTSASLTVCTSILSSAMVGPGGAPKTIMVVAP